MRRALFIFLVVVVLVTGLPVLMNMGHMAACDFCAPGVMLPLLCLAALAIGAVLLPALLGTRLRLRPRLLRIALFATVFERPPQPV